MKVLNRLLALCLVCGFVLSQWSAPPARADSVKASNNFGAFSITNGINTAELGTGGNFNLFAYSIQTSESDMLGPNNSQGQVVPNGAPALNIQKSDNEIQIKKPNPNAALPFGAPTKVKKYGPILTAGPITKPDKANSTYSLSSISGAYNGTASAVNTAKIYRPNGPNKPPAYTRYVQSTATYTIPSNGLNVEGDSAAEVDDPVFVPGDATYGYQPSLAASFQTSGPQSFGAAMFFGIDSTVFPDLDNFVADGSPYENTLWALTILTAGASSSTSIVDASFYLNPLALNEISFSPAYLLTLPGYSPGLTNDELAPLIAAAITASIDQSFSLSGGNTINFGMYSLFPMGTTYTPEETDAQPDGAYLGIGNIAAIAETPAPAPAPAAALLIALAGAASVIRKKSAGRRSEI